MSSTAPSAEERSVQKRHANDLIYASLGEKFDEPIAFFCECDSKRCYDAVWLSAEEYGTRRLEPGWVVRAPVH